MHDYLAKLTQFTENKIRAGHDLLYLFFMLQSFVEPVWRRRTLADYINPRSGLDVRGTINAHAPNSSSVFQDIIGSTTCSFCFGS
jgi:hypothetical protein